MEISYIRQGKSYIATKLTVQAQKLAFGTEEFENQWVFLKTAALWDFLIFRKWTAT